MEINLKGINFFVDPSHNKHFWNDLKNWEQNDLEFVINKLGISSFDSLIPGGRYHDRRDFMNFQSLNRDDLGTSN